MNKTMKQYKGKVLKAMMMLLAVSFALAGTSTLSSCSSDDDPFFTVSEDDNPRILNTNLADQKLDRKTKLNLEIKVTPVHYTTVTWLLDGTQIYEGTTIDQTLPLGNHELKIVATTTKGKSTSRTLNVTVIPAADDPALGTNAIELWVAPGAETTIHKCKNLGTVTKVMVTRSAYALISRCMIVVAIKSAPKNTSRATKPPASNANVMAPRKILCAFLYSPTATLADTSFDTAKGRL